MPVLPLHPPHPPPQLPSNHIGDLRGGLTPSSGEVSRGDPACVQGPMREAQLQAPEGWRRTGNELGVTGAARLREGLPWPL